MHELFKKFSDDFYIWHEPRFKGSNYRTDFAVLSRTAGIIAIEVKDWRLSTIERCSDKEVQLAGVLTTQPNPQEKARGYAFLVQDNLKKNKKLIQTDGAHTGNLKFPCAHGVVFTNITKEEFKKIEKCFDTERVILKDDLDEADKDPAALAVKLKQMCDMFGSWARITDDDIVEIKEILSPEVVLMPDKPGGEKITLDDAQETFARDLVGGHVLLGGIAGSGKSMILLFRAKFLAQEFLDCNVLIMCYNKTWVRGLQYFLDRIVDPETRKRIEVKTFHSLCAGMMRTNFSDELLREPAKLGAEFLKFIEEHKPPKYGAILIDEGQDFDDSWIRCLTHLVRSDTIMMVLAYDNNQRLYKKTSWAEATGLKVVGSGHSLFLNYNYRNSHEITKLAEHFMNKKIEDADGKQYLTIYECYRREKLHGPLPKIFIGDKAAQINYIADKSAELIKNGVSPGSIAVLMIKFDDVDHNKLMDSMAARGIKSKYTGGKTTYDADRVMDKRQFDIAEDTVKITSIHSFKGYETDVVFLTDIGGISDANYENSKPLIYVGITRAKKIIHIISSKKNKLVEEIDGVIKILAK